MIVSVVAYACIALAAGQSCIVGHAVTHLDCRDAEVLLAQVIVDELRKEHGEGRDVQVTIQRCRER